MRAHGHSIVRNAVVWIQMELLVHDLWPTAIYLVLRAIGLRRAAIAVTPSAGGGKHVSTVLDSYELWPKNQSLHSPTNEGSKSILQNAGQAPINVMKV